MYRHGDSAPSVSAVRARGDTVLRGHPHAGYQYRVAGGRFRYILSGCSPDVPGLRRAARLQSISRRGPVVLNLGPAQPCDAIRLRAAPTWPPLNMSDAWFAQARSQLSRTRRQPGRETPGLAQACARLATRAASSPLVSALFGGGLVLLHHAGGDTPTRTDRDAVVVGPGPDIAAALPARGSAARPPGLASPGLAGVLDERRQRLPEGGGVFGGQIDLILRPAEGEPDGLIGRAATEGRLPA